MSGKFVKASDIDLSGVTPRSIVISQLESAAQILRDNPKGDRDGSAEWRIKEALAGLEKLKK